jgi:hypothetical protein
MACSPYGRGDRYGSTIDAARTSKPLLRAEHPLLPTTFLVTPKYREDFALALPIRFHDYLSRQFVELGRDRFIQ